MKDIKMILCDLDGTLLNDQKVVSDLNKQAIRACKKQGIKFGLASGRPLEPIIHFIEEWGMTDLVDCVLAMNGGIIYNTATKKKEEYFLLEGDLIRRIMDHFKELDVCFMLFDKAIRYVNKSNPETLKHAEVYAEEETEADLYQLCNRLHNKIIVRCNPDYMPIVEEHAKKFISDECVGFKSAKELYEYVDPRVNKSFGAQKLCELFNLSMNQVLAFGDTSNDNELLNDAGCGVWMCNGTSDTKAVSDDTAKSNNEDGVGHYIFEKILKKRP